MHGVGAVIRGKWARAGLAAALVVALGAIGSEAWAQKAPKKPRTKRVMENAKLFQGDPPTHIGEYPAFKMTWQAEQRLRDVRLVFPHPLMARRVVVATGTGLTLSDNWGKEWKDIPATAEAALGNIRHVEFGLARPNIIYVATSKGVWQIDDPAKAPMQIGSKASGLINDSVQDVRVEGGDPTFRTLLATHGVDAAGMSRSQDGGKTWKPVPQTNEYYIDKVFCGGPGLSWAYLTASQGDPAASRRVYFCLSVGDFLKDFSGDAQVNDGALEILFNRPFAETSDLSYWATANSGLMYIDHSGTNTERIGPKDIDKWSSIGVTWGATADSKILYGYAPGKLGIAVSTDDGKTFKSFGEGLPAGGFVKQGAHVRANAGGSLFYAAINNTLYVGRRHSGAVAISEIDVAPAAIWFSATRYGDALNRFRSEMVTLRSQKNVAASAEAALKSYTAIDSTTSEMAFSVTARITDDEEATDTAPAKRNEVRESPVLVTADLSRLGGSTAARMYDDGMHGDGAPNDGVYGTTLLLRPDRLRNWYQDKRRPVPGAMALTITAVSTEGTLSSAVGVLGVYERAESHAFWSANLHTDWKTAEGGITGTVEDFLAVNDKKALKITTKDKPWTLALANWYDRSVVGYDAFSFVVKSDGAPKELYVQLKDFSPDSGSVVTVKVPIVKEGLIEGGTIGKDYRRVVIPIAKLLKEPPEGEPRFRPSMLRAMVISGEADAPNFWIGPVRMVASGQDPKKDGEADK